MHDGVNLESRLLPTADIVTTAFLHEADVQRAALGMQALEPVVITHPLRTLTDAQIDQRVEEAVEQTKRIWLGG